jgi:predicted RNA-binding Zn-ribbon protein involved in translation (DUF1610 family)
MSNIAYLEWSLHVECPSCGEEFDLCDQDFENAFGQAIFTNKWNDLIGEEVTCDHCGYEFELDEVQH